MVKGTHGAAGDGVGRREEIDGGVDQACEEVGGDCRVGALNEVVGGSSMQGKCDDREEGGGGRAHGYRLWWVIRERECLCCEKVEEGEAVSGEVKKVRVEVR